MLTFLKNILQKIFPSAEEEQSSGPDDNVVANLLDKLLDDNFDAKELFRNRFKYIHTFLPPEEECLNKLIEVDNIKKGTILENRIKIEKRLFKISRNLLFRSKPVKAPLVEIYPKKFILKGIPKKRLFMNEETLIEIHNEITYHQRLNHQYILPLLETIETKSFIFLVTPYENLQDLHYYVYDTEKPIIRIRRTILFIFWQIAVAVLYLYENHIFHRDLKLENILYDPENIQIKLLDFGLATELDVNKVYTRVCGTPDYLAPEMINQAYTYKIESWAMGIMLHEMLFRYHPFIPDDKEMTRERLLEMIKRGDIFQEFINSDNVYYLPTNLRDLLINLLAIDPYSRLDIPEILYHPAILENELTPKSYYKKVTNTWSLPNDDSDDSENPDKPDDQDSNYSN